MNKFTIAYFGSSNFSADFLEKLISDQSINRLITVKFVVTQPDRPVGRKQILTPTPVKVIAEKYKIKSKILNHKSQINNKFQIKNSKRLEFGASNLFGACDLEFSALKNIDLALVYAFGVIIPQELLTLPKYGFWCFHPSLLPKYRGTSPMATALVNGDKETGVTIIKMDEEIDHGPIIIQEKYQILPTDKRPDLEKKLTELGFQMFRSVILNLVQDLKTRSRNKFGMTLKEQNHQQATYTKKFSKQDGFIEFKNLKFQISNSPKKLFNLFRGLYPWPGLWTLLRPAKRDFEGQVLKRLKITDMDYKDGKIIIKKVQLEGKKEVDFETFKKAYKIF